MLKIMITAAILLGLAAPTASAATKHRRAPVNAAVYNATASRPASGGVSLSTACTSTQSPCRTQPDTW
ncbi:MAG: hypothetical protein ACTHJS_04905 [Xanthobacteraceae bacterium]|jgi:hypothetical protein